MKSVLFTKHHIPENQLMYSNKDLRHLLIPLVIENVLSALMGMADTFMVSNVGAASLSGVSLVDNINVLILFIFTALSAGGTIVCAQYLGSENQYEAKKSAEQLIMVSTLISLVPMVICMLFHNGIIGFVFGQIEADVRAEANIYFFITAVSYPFIAVQQSCASLFRAEGNSKTPMKVTMIANVINVAGNAILIFGFGMGAAGAALATLISRIVSAVWMGILQKGPNLKLGIDSYFAIRPDWNKIKLILKIGIPTGVENGLFQLGKLLVASTVATLGTVSISAQAMVQLFEGLQCYPAMAIGVGLVTVSGTCIGAGRVDQAKYYTSKLCLVSEIVVVAMCLLMAPFFGTITRIASLSPEASAIFMQCMWFIFFCKPFLWVLAFTLPNTMRAAGDVKFGATVSAISMWIFRVGLSTVLCRFMGVGLIGVWIGWITDWVVRVIIFMIRYQSGKWALKKVI